MKKILEFGKRMMFYVRVLSGYEERRIRTMRLEMEKRVLQVSAHFLSVCFTLVVVVVQL